MSDHSGPTVSRSSDDHRRSGAGSPPHREGTGGDTRRTAWLVRYQGHEERVEADDVEITASGVLVFYRLASRLDRERTLLTAISPGLCWRCELEETR